MAKRAFSSHILVSVEEINKFLEAEDEMENSPTVSTTLNQISQSSSVSDDSDLMKRYGTPPGEPDDDWVPPPSPDNEENSGDEISIVLEGTPTAATSLPSTPKSNQFKSFGRNKATVWNQFSTTKNGTEIINKCKACGAKVSAKPTRMRKHVEMCSKTLNAQVLQPIVPASANAQVLQPIVPASANAVPVSIASSSGQDTHNFLHGTSSVNHSNNTQIGIQNFVNTISQRGKEQIDKSLGKFLFSANIAFNVIENKEFADFIKLLNPAYQIPSHDKIGSTVLDAVYKDVRGVMEKQLKGTKGVLLQDGWSSNQNDSVIANCLRSGENTHFLSTNNPSIETANAEYCFKIIEEAIQEAKLEFDCDIVGVVTDNCNTMLALQQLISQKYPEIETLGCNSHLFNLVGKYFTTEDLKICINFVQKFMKSHHFTMASLKKRKANMPVLPGSTRWNSQIDCFLNYKQNHADYLNLARDMKRQTLDKKTKEDLEKVLQVLQNSKIFDNVESTIKVLEPICRALDATQRNSALAADAVYSWIKLDQELPPSISEDRYYQKQRKLGMIPVSIAAYLLHPKYKGEGLSDIDKNLGIKWISSKTNLYIQFCGEITKRQSVYFYDSFLDTEVQSSMKPLDWWKQAATSAVPNGFIRIIEILFALPAGSSGIERCFSTLGNIMTKQRNRLSLEKATKLCCINGFYKILNESRVDQSERRSKKRKFDSN